MARRVLADFDAEILLRLANRKDITATQRAQFFHDAYLLVASEFPHPELQGVGTETLTANTSTLAPSSITDLWWPQIVRDETNDRLIDSIEMQKMLAKRVSTGVPTEYYWWGNVFNFDKAPSTNLTLKIWYKKRPEELTAGQSPVIGREFDLLIIMRAALIGHETVGNQHMATIQASEYNRYAQHLGLPTLEEAKNDRRKQMQVRLS